MKHTNPNVQRDKMAAQLDEIAKKRMKLHEEAEKLRQEEEALAAHAKRKEEENRATAEEFDQNAQTQLAEYIGALWEMADEERKKWEQKRRDLDLDIELPRHLLENGLSRARPLEGQWCLYDDRAPVPSTSPPMLLRTSTSSLEHVSRRNTSLDDNESISFGVAASDSLAEKRSLPNYSSALPKDFGIEYKFEIPRADSSIPTASTSGIDDLFSGIGPIGGTSGGGGGRGGGGGGGSTIGQKSRNRANKNERYSAATASSRVDDDDQRQSSVTRKKGEAAQAAESKKVMLGKLANSEVCFVPVRFLQYSENKIGVALKTLGWQIYPKLTAGMTGREVGKEVEHKLLDLFGKDSFPENRYFETVNTMEWAVNVNTHLLHLRAPSGVDIDEDNVSIFSLSAHTLKLAFKSSRRIFISLSPRSNHVSPLAVIRVLEKQLDPPKSVASTTGIVKKKPKQTTRGKGKGKGKAEPWEDSSDDHDELDLVSSDDDDDVMVVDPDVATGRFAELEPSNDDIVVSPEGPTAPLAPLSASAAFTNNEDAPQEHEVPAAEANVDVQPTVEGGPRRSKRIREPTLPAELPVESRVQKGTQGEGPPCGLCGLNGPLRRTRVLVNLYIHRLNHSSREAQLVQVADSVPARYQAAPRANKTKVLQENRVVCQRHVAETLYPADAYPRGDEIEWNAVLSLARSQLENAQTVSDLSTLEASPFYALSCENLEGMTAVQVGNFLRGNAAQGTDHLIPFLPGYLGRAGTSIFYALLQTFDNVAPASDWSFGLEAYRRLVVVPEMGRRVLEVIANNGTLNFTGRPGLQPEAALELLFASRSHGSVYSMDGDEEIMDDVFGKACFKK